MFSKCESQSHKDCLYSTVLANCNVIVCDGMDFVRSRIFKLDAFALLYITPFFHENQKTRVVKRSSSNPVVLNHCVIAYPLENIICFTYPLALSFNL